MLATALTRSLGIRHPLVLAPMYGAGGGALAGAVSAAGGLGMLGVGSATSLDWIVAEAARARPHGRFGIGLLTWALAQRPELLEQVLAERPQLIALSFGDPTPYVARIHASGSLVASQVQDAATAQQAVTAGVDIVVAQGTEAGGHTGAVGTLPLLQRVLLIGEQANRPVLAAGGLATGRGIAGVLAMGAAGAWVGTRFVATTESLATERAKQAIVQASEGQTVHTHVFDLVQNLAWPDAYPGRALRNAFTERWHGQEPRLREQLEAVQAAFAEARARGDYDELFIYAGQAVGLIQDLPTAGALVQRLMAEAEATLRHTAGIVVTADERAQQAP